MYMYIQCIYLYMYMTILYVYICILYVIYSVADFLLSFFSSSPPSLLSLYHLSPSLSLSLSSTLLPSLPPSYFHPPYSSPPPLSSFTLSTPNSPPRSTYKLPRPTTIGSCRLRKNRLKRFVATSPSRSESSRPSLTMSGSSASRPRALRRRPRVSCKTWRISSRPRPRARRTPSGTARNCMYVT